MVATVPAVTPTAATVATPTVIPIVAPAAAPVFYILWRNRFRGEELMELSYMQLLDIPSSRRTM